MKYVLALLLCLPAPYRYENAVPCPACDGCGHKWWLSLDNWDSEVFDWEVEFPCVDPTCDMCYGLGKINKRKLLTPPGSGGESPR